MFSSKSRSRALNRNLSSSLFSSQILLSAAAGFLLAAGLWMVRPFGINAMDLFIVPGGIGAVVLLFQKRDLQPWIAFLTLSLAIGVLWPPVLLLTAATSLRIAALSAVCYWLYRNGSLRGLYVGLLVGFALQVLVLPAVMLESRTNGIAPTISLLGMVGYSAFTIFSISSRRSPMGSALLAIGVITIAASGARAPFAGAIAIEVIRRRRLQYIALLAVVFVSVVFAQGGMHRLVDVDVLVNAIEVRMASAGIQGHMSDDTYAVRRGYLTSRADGTDALIDDQSPRPPIEAIRGVGISSYHAVIGWPRPHNMFTLAWREMGTLLLVPVFLLFVAIRRGIFGVGLIAAIAIYGLMDDSLLSSNGHYAFASILLVEAMARRYRNAL